MDNFNTRKLLHEELTYKVRGALYEVHRALGSVHKEIVYQKAVAQELVLQNIPFVQEQSVPVLYKKIKVGIYRPDFVIDGKVVLEIKVTQYISRAMQEQVWYYIRGTPYRLVLLANFGKPSMEIERRIF